MLLNIHTHKQRRTGFILALIGATCFSFKAIFLKFIYREGSDAVDAIMLRMIFSLPFFVAIGWWAQCHQPYKMIWKDYWQISLIGSIGYYLSSILDFKGLEYISVGLERLLMFLVPSIVLILSKFWLKKEIGKLQWLAMIVAYAGIILVFVQEVSFGGANVVLGSTLVFCATVSYSFYLLMTGELVKRLGAVRLVAYAMAVSTVCCVIHYSLVRDVLNLFSLTLKTYIYSLLNAVLCTVIPVVFTMLAVARLGSPIVSQVGMIGPVMILGFGYWFLGEPITLVQLIGTALVLLGIGLVGKIATLDKSVDVVK